MVRNNMSRKFYLLNLMLVRMTWPHQPLLHFKQKVRIHHGQKGYPIWKQQVVEQLQEIIQPMILKNISIMQYPINFLLKDLVVKQVDLTEADVRQPQGKPHSNRHRSSSCLGFFDIGFIYCC